MGAGTRDRSAKEEGLKQLRQTLPRHDGILLLLVRASDIAQPGKRRFVVPTLHEVRHWSSSVLAPAATPPPLSVCPAPGACTGRRAALRTYKQRLVRHRALPTPVQPVCVWVAESGPGAHPQSVPAPQRVCWQGGEAGACVSKDQSTSATTLLVGRRNTLACVVALLSPGLPRLHRWGRLLCTVSLSARYRTVLLRPAGHHACVLPAQYQLRLEPRSANSLHDALRTPAQHHHTARHHPALRHTLFVPQATAAPPSCGSTAFRLPAQQPALRALHQRNKPCFSCGSQAGPPGPDGGGDGSICRSRQRRRRRPRCPQPAAA